MFQNFYHFEQIDVFIGINVSKFLIFWCIEVPLKHSCNRYNGKWIQFRKKLRNFHEKVMRKFWEKLRKKYFRGKNVKFGYKKNLYCWDFRAKNSTRFFVKLTCCSYCFNKYSFLTKILHSFCIFSRNKFFGKKRYFAEKFAKYERKFLHF